MNDFYKFLETYSNSQWDGIESPTFGQGHSMNMPDPTYNFPTENFTSKIRRVVYNQKPIVVEFENGRVWRIKEKQWNYLKSIGRKPKQGATADVAMTPDGVVQGFSQRPSASSPQDNRQSSEAGSSRRPKQQHGKLPKWPPIAF
jgi:hypothetical protein